MENYSTPSLINRHLVTTTPDTPVVEALTQMKQSQSSCLLVLTSQQPTSPLVGFTQRDVVRLAALGVNWQQLEIAYLR
jgi:CBS-domain-containing membrane protein